MPVDFRLSPLADATPTFPSPDPASLPGGRLRVLLGDACGKDEPWHRTAAGLLAAQGVEVHVAETGRHAFGLIEDGLVGGGPRIHVAVLEHRMSDMTAVQMLRRLHEELLRRATANVTLPPAILLAPAAERGRTDVASGLMHEALTARVFSVLPRPVDPNLLLDTLARALRRFYAGRWPGGETSSKAT